MGSSDAAAQLMKLGQPETVGPVDDDGVGAGNIDAGLDDRGRNQDVETLFVEIQHDFFQLTFRHLAVGDADAGIRQHRLEIAGGLFDSVDVVVQEINLAATRQFALECLEQDIGVPRTNEGFDRDAVRRRCSDDGQLAQAAHRHVQRTRYRRGGQRQQVDIGLEGLQCFLMAHAEALLLIDDDQAEAFEGHILLQQAVRADDYIDFSEGEMFESPLDFFRTLEPGKHLDADRPIGEAVTEIPEMLLGQQGRRYQHRHLLAGHGRDECSS